MSEQVDDELSDEDLLEKYWHLEQINPDLWEAFGAGIRWLASTAQDYPETREATTEIIATAKTYRKGFALALATTWLIVVSESPFNLNANLDELIAELRELQKPPNPIRRGRKKNEGIYKFVDRFRSGEKAKNLFRETENGSELVGEKRRIAEREFERQLNEAKRYLRRQAEKEAQEPGE